MNKVDGIIGITKRLSRRVSGQDASATWADLEKEAELLSALEEQFDGRRDALDSYLKHAMGIPPLMPRRSWPCLRIGKSYKKRG